MGKNPPSSHWKFEDSNLDTAIPRPSICFLSIIQQEAMALNNKYKDMNIASMKKIKIETKSWERKRESSRGKVGISNPRKLFYFSFLFFSAKGITVLSSIRGGPCH